MKFLPTAEERKAIKEMREAARALRALRVTEETPEYLRLNRIANEKARLVPRIFGGTKKGR